MGKNDGAASLVRSDALLGCPFCGREPKMCVFDDEVRRDPILGNVTTSRKLYAVRCDCDCMMHDKPGCGQAWWKIEDAVREWNTRSPNNALCVKDKNRGL